MSSRGVVPKPVQTPDRLLTILCPHEHEHAVQKALTRHVGSSWEWHENIRVLSVPRNEARDVQRTTARVKAVLGRWEGVATIIKFNGIELDEHGTLEGKIAVIQTPGLRKFEEDILPAVLKLLHLDWLSVIVEKLGGRWRHGVLDRTRIEDWIRQHRTLGNHEWVAERLLKILDFWSDDRVRTSLRITPDALAGFDCIAINRYLPGKSADALSNLIQKQLEANGLTEAFSRVMDFGQAVDSSDTTRILFIEDCLLTGNEMVRVLMALQGEEDTFGKPRAERLQNPELLYSKEIKLRFVIASNGGLVFLRKYLREHRLNNIEVENPIQGVLTTFTPQGLEALESDSFYDSDKCIVDLERYIFRAAFQQKYWPSEDKRIRALQFCSSIGLQLYSLYLEKENKNWIEKRIQECALGMRSYALTLAFQHSVPKETLPLFWYSGTINWNDKTLPWISLFQNAA